MRRTSSNYRTTSTEKDAAGGGRGLGWVLGAKRGCPGAERMVSQPWSGGLAGLRGNAKFKQYKILCNVVRAVKSQES